MLLGLLLVIRIVGTDTAEARWDVLPVPYASPAKAGARYRAARDWTPAFAGEAFPFREADDDGPAGRATSTQPGSMSPIDAERAFAADAKAIGQWTAFRKWSTDDAVMFVPQTVNAHEFLKDRKDPPNAIDWWPTASYIACDGSLAVNTGGWKRADGSVGYFSTVWQRQPGGGWKWIVDGGDTLKIARPRAADPLVVRAKCVPHLFSLIVLPGSGISRDDSLGWSYDVQPDGSRKFTVDLQNADMSKRTVIEDVIPAPK